MILLYLIISINLSQFALMDTFQGEFILIPEVVGLRKTNVKKC